MQTRTLAPPSGDQYEIVDGIRRAIVTEVGATLRAFSVAGIDIVDGFDEHAMSTAGRGQVLAPWPNRLEDGSYTFDGCACRAALDEPELGNAIHGLVRWLPWRTVHRSAHAVRLSCVLHPQPAYGWRLALEVEYRLDAHGLTVAAEATNRSVASAPFGIGFHPYLSAGASTVDDALLTVRARRRLLTDERGLPRGSEEVAGTTFDFSSARPIGGARLDTAFTDLDRDPDGRATIRFEAPRPVAVWMERPFAYAMVYTGDTLDPPSRRRRGVAIEPMTSPPNALRTGTDLIRLEPDTPWSAEWGIEA